MGKRTTKILHNSVTYKKFVYLVDDSGNWESELFCVKRFQCDGDATFDLESGVTK